MEKGAVPRNQGVRSFRDKYFDVLRPGHEHDVGVHTKASKGCFERCDIVSAVAGADARWGAPPSRCSKRISS